MALAVGLLCGAGSGLAVILVRGSLGTETATPSAPVTVEARVPDSDPDATPGLPASDPVFVEPQPTSPDTPAAQPVKPGSGPENPGNTTRNDPAQLIAEIVSETNAQRANNGLAPLSLMTCDTQQADARVAQLVRENGFYHLDLKPILSACGVHAVGENLALGYHTGAAVVAAWMDSPGHRQNLLGDYTNMGISCQLEGTAWLCAAVYSR